MSMERYLKVTFYGDQTKRTLLGGAGGLIVTKANDTAPVTLYDYRTHNQITTVGVPIVNGGASVLVDDNDTGFDLYCYSSYGHMTVVRGWKYGEADVWFPVKSPQDSWVFPVDGATIGTGEYSFTGVELPEDLLVTGWTPGFMATEGAVQTLNVGILSSESGGDADGFMAAIPMTAGMNPAGMTGANAGSTLGALLVTQVTGATGYHDRKAHRCDGTAKTVSVTASAATVGKGRIILSTDAGALID